MLNTTKEPFLTIKKLYDSTNIDNCCEHIRKSFASKDGQFSIFDMLSSLDTMVILFDDKINASTRYISFSKEEKRNYLVLSADRKVEELRFDAACMLAKICKKVEQYEYSSLNEFFSQKSMIDTDFVFGIIAKEDFVDFNNEPSIDRCLEIEEKPLVKVTDEQAKKIIQKYYKARTISHGNPACMFCRLCYS